MCSLPLIEVDSITAVVDTNLLLDVYSCHDLAGAYERLLPELGERVFEQPDLKYRMARARESFLLALYFHEIRATTYSLHHEPLALLCLRAPPAPGGHSLEADFVRVFIHFTHEHVIPNWTVAMPSEPQVERGNEADDALLDYARQRALPLITNEGSSAVGLRDDHGLRKKAKDAGVDVFTPREFYAGKIVERRAIDDFLGRYQEHVPRYKARREREFPGDKMGELVDWVLGFYKMILNAEASRDAPLNGAYPPSS